jgi:hypothetical protein
VRVKAAGILCALVLQLVHAVDQPLDIDLLLFIHRVHLAPPGGARRDGGPRGAGGAGAL